MKYNNNLKSFIQVPNWPLPNTVRAVTTQRGFIDPDNPYSTFNLGTHVGDDLKCVQSNRAYLSEVLELTQQPHWLQQVHGTHISNLDQAQPNLSADGSHSRIAQQVCVILTADCLPVLITNQQGNQVAAIHAGWRGLLAGILDKAIACFKQDPSQLSIWLGPCIGPESFVLNAEIRQQFIEQFSPWQEGFWRNSDSPWCANLQQMATQQLNSLGITNIYADNRCTFQHQTQFFSYRRDGKTSGRMAHMIWLVDD